MSDLNFSDALKKDGGAVTKPVPSVAQGNQAMTPWGQGTTRSTILPSIGPELPSATSLNFADGAAGQIDKNINPTLRKAGGKFWSDTTLEDWPESDFRIFCGDIGNEVTDDLLANGFRRYKSFQKAKVIRDKRTGKTKGYGFVSFAHPEDMVAALREVNGRYIGNRPVRLKKSNWKQRAAGSDLHSRLLSYDHLVVTKETSLKKFKKVNKKKAKAKAKTE